MGIEKVFEGPQNHLRIKNRAKLKRNNKPQSDNITTNGIYIISDIFLSILAQRWDGK